MLMIDLFLIVLLMICAYTDLKRRRIYNVVVYPALVISIFTHLIFGGWEGLLFALTGFGTGLALLLIPYLMGGMGAGDVKLMALIGAMKGTAFILTAFLYIAILGGLIALGLLIMRRSVWYGVKRALVSLVLLRRGIRLSPALSVSTNSMLYPYGVAISAGTCITLLRTGGWI